MVQSVFIRQKRPLVKMKAPNDPILELKIEDPLSLFLSMPIFPKFYWHDGQNELHKMAFGAQDSFEVSSFKEFASALTFQKSKLPCFGAAQFEKGLKTYPDTWFTPEIYVNLIADQAQVFADAHSTKTVLERFKALAQTEARLEKNNITFKGFEFNQETWTRRIEKAQSLYKSSELKKIVLARRSHYTLADPKALFSLLKPLFYTAKGISFIFQTGPKALFFGESPETLLRWQDGSFFSEATAGTVGVGKNDFESKQLAEQLLHSQKDINEHDYVVQHLEKVFAEFSSTKSKEDTDILKLFYAQHLKKQFKGTFKNKIDWGALVDALHPTPAVSGYPSGLALETILELEKVSRGFYAGPVGFCHSDFGHLQVAIRSASLSGAELTAYSGAGIMAASDPAKEWDELNLKLQWLHQPLGIIV